VIRVGGGYLVIDDFSKEFEKKESKNMEILARKEEKANEEAKEIVFNSALAGNAKINKKMTGDMFARLQKNGAIKDFRGEKPRI